MAKRFVKCPACSTAMGIGENKIGQDIKCPKCKGVFHSSWKRKPFHLKLKDSTNKLGWVAVGILLMFLVNSSFDRNSVASINGVPCSFDRLSKEPFNLNLFAKPKPKINLQTIPVPSLDENMDMDMEDNDGFIDEFNKNKFDQRLNLKKDKVPIAVWKNGKLPVVEIGWRRRFCSPVCSNTNPQNVESVAKVKSNWILHHTNSYYKYIFPPQFTVDSKFSVNSKSEEELIYNNKTYKVWIFNELAPRVSDITIDGVRYVEYDYLNGVDIVKCQLATKAVLALGPPEEVTGPPIINAKRKPSSFPQ